MIMTLEEKIVKKPIRYKCQTCGEETETINHLCAPRVAIQSYVCTYCGQTTRDPWHVCMSMVEEMKLICKDCGQPDLNLELVTADIA